METVDSFSYLWDGSEPGWVLVKSTLSISGYWIFNLAVSASLDIHDERLVALLCERMIEAGCPILGGLPGASSEATVSPS